MVNVTNILLLGRLLPNRKSEEKRRLLPGRQRKEPARLQNGGKSHGLKMPGSRPPIRRLGPITPLSSRGAAGFPKGGDTVQPAKQTMETTTDKGGSIAHNSSSAWRTLLNLPKRPRDFG